MNNVYFAINGLLFGYNSISIFTSERHFKEKILKTFENILLVKIVREYAVFLLSGKNEYVKFDGNSFTEYYGNL